MVGTRADFSRTAHCNTPETSSIVAPMKAPGERFQVAVFPILDAVLFPGMTLPLQIIEKRYDRMVKELEAAGLPLAVSLAIPRPNQEFALNSICGVGNVHVFQEHEDGRSDVLVRGLQRARLVSVIQEQPYFLMEAEALPPEESLDVPHEVSERVTWLARSWVFANPEVSDDFVLQIQDLPCAAALCDFFAFHFVKKPSEKQLYLDCTDPVERAERLSQFLEKDLARVARKAVRLGKKRLLH